MENVVFWAKNDEEACQIAESDFVNKASKVLESYYSVLKTWVGHTPHTVFYSCYYSMFSGDGSQWLSDNPPIKIKTLSKTSSKVYEKVKSFVDSKEIMYGMMGGGEYPFVYVEKIDNNMYQYHVGR